MSNETRPFDETQWARCQEMLDGHHERLHSHDTRITLTEAQLKEMAPKVEMGQVERRLEKQMTELASTVRAEGQQTQMQIREMAQNVTSLTDAVGTTMKRLGEINEENMLRNAKQVEETHNLKIKTLQEKLDETKAHRLDVQIVRWGGVFGGLTAMAAGLWWLFQFLVTQVPK